MLDNEPVPPSQLFRVLLIRMLETHATLIPIVCHSTSQALKNAHQQNAYTLSEIQSWLEAQLIHVDFTPLYSAAQLAELQVGVASCMRLSQAQQSGARLTPSALPAHMEAALGSLRVRSSQPVARIKPPLARNSTGQIIFPLKSLSAKPNSILPTSPSVIPPAVVIDRASQTV